VLQGTRTRRRRIPPFRRRELPSIYLAVLVFGLVVPLLPPLEMPDVPIAAPLLAPEAAPEPPPIQVQLVAPAPVVPRAALLNKLAEYPDMLAHAADELAPHAVAFYLRDLAGEFHSFYNAERVLVDEEAPRNARIALLAATRQVLANGLATIGVSAPVKM